jgi:glycosyltransferase involved in cell wall biosynthesis
MFVSIIIPMRNEERFIGRCLDSLLPQIRGRDNFEMLCVDGMSTDKTRQIVQEYASRDSRIKLIDNPHKIVPTAMNLAIKQSRGDFIMIVGCHAEYIDKCQEVFERTGADKVGGYTTTVPGKDTAVGWAIATATSTCFGVGPGTRVPGPEREAAQAGFGGYRRDAFDRFGLFDERLVRNQDLEFTCRMHKAGAKIVISPEIRIKYYNRSTFTGLRNQAFINGLWNPYTIWIIGSGTRLKHFVPLGFLLSILALGLAGFVWPPAWLVLTFELLVYVLAALVTAFISTRQTNTSVFLVFLAFVQLHFAYGIGSLWGVITAPFKFGLKRKRQPGKPLEYHRE